MIGDNATTTVNESRLIDGWDGIKILHVYAEDETSIAFYGFQAEDDFIADDVADIILSEGVPILKRLWQSKYNDYVAYDYRPFSTVGFNKRLLIAYDTAKYKYLCHIIRKRYETVLRLESALANV